MLIQCTKKLLDELKIKPTTVTEEKLSLFSWHANLITVNRRKTVVLCNDKNRYVVVLHGLKAKDFINIGALIITAIRETLLEECVKAEIIEQFIAGSPEITFAKTSDRSMTGKLNKACDNVHFFTCHFDSKSIVQPEVGVRASNEMVGDYGAGNYYTPNNMMYKDLEAFGEAPIFRCKALQLIVILDLDNHEVWRRVIIPQNISFSQLHLIMQILFDWQDYHLHDFYIFDGDNPVAKLVCDEESLSYDDEGIKLALENGIMLSEYVPEYTRIKYNYDFGDDWQHYIEVEKVIEDYDKNYPVCLEAVGNALPEDVGGEGGYDGFLAAIADPNHEDYEDMVAWGKMQMYKELDFDWINQRLNSVLRRYI